MDSMDRLKTIAGSVLTIVVVLLILVAQYWWIGENSPPGGCDPYATYDHCGQVGAPGPGGR